MATSIMPGSDHEWWALPQEVRREAALWLDVLQPILDAPHGQIGPMIEAAAGSMAASIKTTRRMFDFARKGRLLKDRGRVFGWKAIVDWRRVRVRYSDKLPDAFVQWWKSLCEKEQRKIKAAYRKLLHIWRHTNNPIPGYETRPVAGPGGIPAGWSYENLLQYAPNDYELMVARQGRAAAFSMRPQVLTTRVGLEAAQYYMADDVEHDLLTNYIGVNRSAMRPLELGIIDLFSACKVRYGVKPVIENDDGTKSKLKERDMRFLLAALLVNAGYRRQGTVFLVEHGTAAIRDEVERVLFDATAGAITVQRSGIEGAPALHGWYEGRGKGNFRLKAALESAHNLVHNETAALPGQMGLSRDRAPEELHGRNRENALLVAACKMLPPEKQALLRFPFIPFYQFREVLEAIYMSINSRTDHRLEGWEEAGLVTSEFRLETSDKRWLPAAHLDQLHMDKRQAIISLIERPGYTRCRRLSPAEVWDQGRRNLVRLPWHIVPAILTNDLSSERKVGRDGMITFEDREIGPGEHRYMGRARTAQGHEVLLVAGETYLTFVNPFDARGMIICGADGSFIGVAPRIDRTPRYDAVELARSMGRAAHEEALRLAPYRARHAQDVEAVAEDRAVNAEIISGAPVLPAEIQTADVLAQTKVSALERAAATERDQDAAREQFSADEISDILRDDPAEVAGAE